MNANEQNQVAIAIECGAKRGTPYVGQITSDNVKFVDCGRVTLSEWKSRADFRTWRAITWKDGEVINSKVWWIPSQESPTPFDQLAEELRNAI